jgi:hypothetical protein
VLSLNPSPAKGFGVCEPAKGFCEPVKGFCEPAKGFCVAASSAAAAESVVVVVVVVELAVADAAVVVDVSVWLQKPLLVEITATVKKLVILTTSKTSLFLRKLYYITLLAVHG